MAQVCFFKRWCWFIKKSLNNLISINRNRRLISFIDMVADQTLKRWMINNKHLKQSIEYVIIGFWWRSLVTWQPSNHCQILNIPHLHNLICTYSIAQRIPNTWNNYLVIIRILELNNDADYTYNENLKRLLDWLIDLIKRN